MPRGGKREGAGRPPGPTGKAKKMRSLRLSDEEYTLVRQYIKLIREAEKNVRNIPLQEV